MKFVLHCAKTGCRVGTFESVGPQNKILETPLCMVYTRGGSAPHLTRDMLDKIGNMAGVAHMPIPLLADQQETLTTFAQGLKKFTVMEDYLLYCSMQDSAVHLPQGYNDRTAIAVWGRGGKMKLDVDHFMQTQEAFQPDAYQALCDMDTDRDSTNKRLRKSLDRTLYFLDKCLEKHHTSERLKNTQIFGTIGGGYSEDIRVTFAKEIAKRPVDGFCIEGFHNFGPDTEAFQYTEVKDLIEKVMAELPKTKPRLLHGILSPDNVLRVLEMGVDIVDSSYPYMVTERGAGLAFNYNLAETQDSLKDSVQTDEQDNPIRQYEINLKDKRYFADFGPLVKGCTCYTCEKHTRAYVNHLLNTSELLAGTLLMVHNFHQYFAFFAAIRQALANGQYEQFKDLIMKQSS